MIFALYGSSCERYAAVDGNRSVSQTRMGWSKTVLLRKWIWLGRIVSAGEHG